MNVKEMLDKKIEVEEKIVEGIDGLNIEKPQAFFWQNTKKEATPNTEDFLTSLVDTVGDRIANIVSVQAVSDDYPHVFYLRNVKDSEGFVVKTVLESKKVEPKEEMVFEIDNLDMYLEMYEQDGEIEEAFYENLENAIFRKVMHRICSRIESAAKEKGEMYEWVKETPQGMSWTEHKLSVGKLLLDVVKTLSKKKGIIIPMSKEVRDLVDSLPNFSLYSRNQQQEAKGHGFLYDHPVMLDLFGEGNRNVFLVIPDEKSTYEAGCIFAPHSLYIRDGKLYLKYDVVVLEAAMVQVV